MIRCPIFMYHQVTPADHPSFNRHLSVTLERFEEQVSYLKDHGFTFITIADLMDHEKLDFSNRRYIVLSFDDIFDTFYQFAFSVLKKYGIPATTFLIGNSFNGEKYENLSPAGLTPLTRDQLQEMADYGIEIGSHAMSHRELTELTDEEARRELLDSFNLVQPFSKTGKVNFCYPRGSHGPKHFGMIQDAGYSSAVITARGNHHDLSHPFKLKRVKVSQKHQGLKLLYLCSWFYHQMNAFKQARKNRASA